MKSKFINWKHLDTTYVSSLDIESQYVNRLNDLGDVLVLDNATGLAFETNYPKTNLHKKSISKECRTNTWLNGSAYEGGITIDPTSGFGNWNTMVLQFNKLNEDLVTKLKTLSVRIQLVDTANSDVRYEIVLANGGTNAENYVADYYGAGRDFYQVQTDKINPEEGLILLDEEITSFFNIQSFPEADYNIRIYFVGASDFDYFSISNIAINNYIEACVSEKLDFQIKNLSKTSMNKRTGNKFMQNNKDVKSLKGAIELLTAEEYLDYKIGVNKFNINSPLFFFPYCENDNNNLSFLNLEHGGLYQLKETFKIKNDSYDMYDIGIDLSEYK
jgi:hypothetical protein